MGKTNYNKHHSDTVLSPIGGEWTDWNGKQRADILNFIKDKLEDSVVDFEYSNSDLMLRGKNAYGEVVSETKIVNADPMYSITASIDSLTIGGVTYAENNTPLQLNGNENLQAYLTVRVNAIGSVAGNIFEDTTLKKAVVGICDSEGNTKAEFDTIELSGITNGTVNLQIGSYLVSAGSTNRLDNLYLYVKIKSDPETNITSETPLIRFAKPITVKTLTISYNRDLLVRQNQVEFTVGGASGSGYYLQYCINSETFSSLVPVQNNQGIIGLENEGVHKICARVVNNNKSLYSKWLSVNVIYLKLQDSSLSSALATITNIPSSVLNCDTPKLCDIITTDKLAGNINIYIYKAENDDVLSPINTTNYLEYSQYLFKQTQLSLKDTTESLNIPYYSFIELDDVNSSSSVFLKFIIESNGEATIFNSILGVSNTAGSACSFKSLYDIQISESDYNEEKELQHTAGAIIDYSQISRGTLFNNVIDNLDKSDGFQIGEGDDAMYSYFKVSPTTGLFKQAVPLKYGDIYLPDNKLFSIELLIKSYNINDSDDELMSLGNIKIYPDYLRLDDPDKGIVNGELSVNSLYVSSRADFSKDKITHILITYNEEYVPDTYDYDKLFTGATLSYSGEKAKGKLKYGCLKIYINGTINRVRQIRREDLFSNNKFDLQIHPSTSDLNIYGFRTYSKCLNYAEIQKNRISAIPSNIDKINTFIDNDYLFNDYDYSPTKVEDMRSLLGTINLGKCTGTFVSHTYPKRTYKQKNILLFVLPQGDVPLYYNHKGKDASILVKYAEESDDTEEMKQNKKNASGRLFGKKLYGNGYTSTRVAGDDFEDYYKNQGTSANKYALPHNTSFAKFYFVPEEFFGDDEESHRATTYALPNEPDKPIEKLVGKVNVASSMQSHKRGACKLYDSAYKNIFASDLEKLNGGHKAVNQDPFLYFYINIDDCIQREGLNLTNVTWDDIDYSKAKFFGFQTWGSAKGDKPTFGYHKKGTPEYIVFEGADNANPCTNFKAPWAALQMYSPSNNNNFYNNPIKEQLSGLDADGNPDYITGLLIDDETIMYRTLVGNEDRSSDEKNPDSWDVSFGIEEKDAETDKYFYLVKDKAKPSFNQFAEFCNMVYTFDFTSFEPLPDQSELVMDSENFDIAKKYVCRRTSMTIKKNSSDTGFTMLRGDVIRWDCINLCWVPGGLYHHNTITSGVDDVYKWDAFNIRDIFNEIVKETVTHDSKYHNLFVYDSENVKLSTSASGEYTNFSTLMPPLTADNFNNMIKLAIKGFAEVFKMVCQVYLDINDATFHQALIRLVSGTDNRAKNTYFLIIGKLYDEITGILLENQPEHPYKIRMFLDDLDTIFKTDNNGQQIKPYNLLEPPFDKDNESLWGDSHSGLMYGFDIAFNDLIKTLLGNIIEFALGNKDFTDPTTEFYKDFLYVLKYFPAITYNHTSELYYESVQTMFSEGIRSDLCTEVFGSKFSNNQVSNPVSLSHGSCYEAEEQFLKERFYMLSTYTKKGKTETGVEIKSRNETGGSGALTFTLNLSDVGFIQDNYPTIISTQLLKENNSELNYDSIIDEIPYSTDAERDPYLWELAKAGYNKYGMNVSVTMQVSGAGSTWTSTDMYKTITLNSGFSKLGNINFPKASDVTINTIDSDESYTMEDATSNILDMSNYVACVERLNLIGVKFNNDVVDFSKCTRLKELNLSNCTAKQNSELTLNLPDSNKLTHVTLPSCIKNLNFEYYPELTAENFNFDEIPNLLKLTINCSNNIGVIHKLLDRYINADTEIVLTNIPSIGIWLTPVMFNNLVNRDSLSITGTIWIGEEATCVGNLNNCEPITWQDKALYALKFGNIDTGADGVTIKYKPVTTTSASILLSAVLPASGPAPIGLQIEGNTIGIVDHRLNIIYYLGLTGDIASIDNTTGYITLNSTTGSINVGATIITKDGISIVALTSTGSDRCIITIGFREPKIGDFAYADGHFDNTYDPTQGIVGFVTYVKGEGNLDSNQHYESYDVRICSWFGLSGNYVLGPATDVMENITSWEGYFIEQQASKQSAVYRLMNMMANYSSTTTISFNGQSSVVDTSYDKIKFPDTSSSITHISPITSTARSKPETMACGKSVTESHYKEALANLKILTLASMITSSDISTLDGVSETENKLKVMTGLFNNQTNDTAFYVTDLSGNSYGGYYELIYPAYTRTYLWKPSVQNLHDDYAEHNWYIPSVEEYEWLIYNRVRSCMKNEGTEGALDTDKWNSTTFTSIASDGYLNSYYSSSAYMRLTDAVVSGDSSKIPGGNYSYGYHGTESYWEGNYTIGWTPAPRNSIYTNSYKASNRDYPQYIIPFCQRTIYRDADTD